jgi:hypothetical protein
MLFLAARMEASEVMGLLLFADEATVPNKWFEFVKAWGDSASVVGLVVSIIGLAITIWGFVTVRRRQAEIKKEVDRALRNAARMVIQDSIQQLLQKTIRVRGFADLQAWQSAHDACEDARRLTLGAVANPHLTDAERNGLTAHADDLIQIRDYIRRNKLIPNPPAVFQADKRTALDNLEVFAISVLNRLQAIVWGP